MNIFEIVNKKKLKRGMELKLTLNIILRLEMTAIKKINNGKLINLIFHFKICSNGINSPIWYSQLSYCFMHA